MNTYTGGCHCGAIRYEVTMDLDRVIECNCSHCSQKGLLLAFADADQFSLRTGEDKLSDYQFNKNIIHHLFCSGCGVQSFARGKTPDGKPMVAINLRCLDGVDWSSLNRIPVDGRSR